MSLTGNDQVFYFGQDAIFSVLIDLNQTEVNDVFPIIYIDGCKVENNNCVKSKNGSEIELRCTIHNISKSDVGTRIKFFGISAVTESSIVLPRKQLDIESIR